MPNILGNDFVHYTADGIFFYDSSSILTPSTSQSSQPQITQITCSADFENNIASIGSLSGYFVVPLIGGFPNGIGDLTVGENFAVASPSQTTLVPSQLNVVYNTGSFFAVSGSNENFYHQPTSSEDIINYILNVSIEKNDSPNLVALKTYNVITGSLIYRGATDSEGASFGFNYISASLTGSAITIFNTFSQSIDSVFISGGANLGGIGDFTVGENFTVGYSPFASNIIQSGSYGSGSFTNFVAPRGELRVQSSSLVIGRDIEDTTQSSFIFRVQSGSFGGNEHRDILYVSASEGKLGLGTTDPLTDIDIRADEFQIQRKTERRGLKINNEGNIESFSSDLASATTGSEFLLRYSRGIEITPRFMATFAGLTGNATGSDNANALDLFNALKPDVQARALSKAEVGGQIRPPATGDTLGQIRWVTDSGSLTGLNPRVTGETAVIKAVVSDADSTGTRADLIFSVASKTAGATQKFLIDALNKHQITGSLEVSDDLVVKDDLIVIDDVSIGGDLEITGTTSVSSNLSTSGTFLAGNAISDTSTFKGNITASGNISGSITTNLTIGNTGSFGAIQMNDNKVIHFGNGSDLGIWHDGSNSYIHDSGTGRLKIKGGAGVDIISPADENMATFEGNGAVNLYFNNNKKFETTNTGVSASGNVIAAGVRLPGAAKISFDDSLDGTDQFISGVDNQIVIDGDNFVKVFSDKFTTFYNSSNEDHFTIQHESGSIVTDYNIIANYIETAKIPLIQYISTETTSIAQGRVLAASSHNNATDSFALEWDTPLFHDTDFFETGSVSPTTSGAINTFAVKQTGRYEINCNVTFRGTSGARPGINLGIFTSSMISETGSLRPAGPAAHAYVRLASPANGSTAAIPGFVIQLSSGSAVSMKVDIKDDFGATGNTFWSGSLSHFNMKKIG